MIDKENYIAISEEVKSHGASLIAVSKTKPVEAIKELYHLGHRDFGENYVQELVEKQAQLPSDIRWHFIGHLQSNKVKYIAPFVRLIHSIDSYKLLKEVDKQAKKISRVINVLLQVHIAQEETKFGFNEQELHELFATSSSHKLHEQTGSLQALENVQIAGLMGMASFSDDQDLLRSEFKNLKRIYNQHAEPQPSNYKLQTLSMGMSADFKIALEEGSNMIRIGSMLFGKR